MSDATARLALPMIVAGQAQKEMTHNEALALLDAAVQASVVAVGIDDPPSAPDSGQCWIVGAAPTGAWIGRADALAIWTAGGWRFVAPTPGFRVWATDSGVEARFVGGAWVAANPAPAIAAPAGGATIDAEARSTIAAILVALQHHNLLQPA